MSGRETRVWIVVAVTLDRKVATVITVKAIVAALSLSAACAE